MKLKARFQFKVGNERRISDRERAVNKLHVVRSWISKGALSDLAVPGDGIYRHSLRYLSEKRWRQPLALHPKRTRDSPRFLSNRGLGLPF